MAKESRCDVRDLPAPEKKQKRQSSSKDVNGNTQKQSWSKYHFFNNAAHTLPKSCNKKPNTAANHPLLHLNTRQPIPTESNLYSEMAELTPQTRCAQQYLYRCLAHWNRHLELFWKHAFLHAERHSSCVALGELHSKVAAKCQAARSLTPMRHTISNPHTSQPDPHMASDHIMIVGLSTMQKHWIQQFAPMFGRYV